MSVFPISGFRRGSARIFRVLCVVFCVLPVMQVSAQQTLEQRVARIEQMTGTRALLDMNNQLQLLQSEVRQLRGQLEQAVNELAMLKSKQQQDQDETMRQLREMFQDMDRRLSRIELNETRSESTPIERDGVEREVETPQVRIAQRSSSSMTSGGEDLSTEVAVYRAAFDHLKQGRYQQSVEGFQLYMERYPKGTYADNSQYWLGEANYVIRNFDQAMLEFNKVLSEFPSSPKVPDALLKIGFIHYEQARWGEARAILEKLRNDHPSSTASGLAAQRLDRMQREGR
jgi:tol-pal system protein YbgF